MPTVVDDARWHQSLRKLSRADRMALLVAAGLLALVSLRWHAYQWDFYMFYGSARDFLHGASPYRGEGLSFYHPPLTLYLYGVFARLPFPLAYQLWLFLKVAALAALLLLWTRHFLKLDYTWRTTLYFLLAYNGAVYADLVSGNISIFEQCGLWFGFAALVNGRYARFCLCVILVAQFKLTPIFFALLLLVAPKRPQWKWFAVCCSGFVAVLSLNFVLQPALLQSFLHVAPALDERGTLAPGTLALIRDIFDLVGGPNFSDGTRADEAIFLMTALAVAGFSLLAIARYRRTVHEPDARRMIYFACLAYPLLIPRMKAYSYILLLIPTLYLLRGLPRKTLVPVAVATLAAMVVFPNGASLLPFRLLSQLFYEYLPLVAAFSLWLVFFGALKHEQAPDVDGPLISHSRG